MRFPNSYLLTCACSTTARDVQVYNALMHPINIIIIIIIIQMRYDRII